MVQAMSELVFHWIVIVWIIIALAIIPVQLYVTAPFGRHTSEKWGPQIGNRAGWIIMEIVSPVVLLVSFYLAGADLTPVTFLLLAVWVMHYFNRSAIYPMRIKTSGKKIPVFIVASAILFNSFNGWSNGTYLGSGWGVYANDWLVDPRFIIGILVMAVGVVINLRSDDILIKLRSSSETNDYHIPRGGLFEKVSCPNFLGEIIEWTGFAIACWNLPALGFAVWTAANLIPRALSHHRWYREKFPDYPEARRAILPGLL